MQHERRRAAHMQRLVAGLGTSWHQVAGTKQGDSGSERVVVRFRCVASCGASKRPGGTYRQA